MNWLTWRGIAFAAVASLASAGPACADPAGPVGPDIQPVVAAAEAIPPAADPAAAPGAAAAGAVPPPVDDGKVVSPPPEILKSMDGWTLTIGGKDETQRVIAPLTTAVSSREYEVGGTYAATLKDPSGKLAPAKGVLEVGYQIGCGIDMSTGTGVLLGGSVGGQAGLTTLGPLSIFNPIPSSQIILFPNAGVNAGGSIAVSLKPGVINVVPVTKKNYGGSEPWVWVSHQRIKIDGCVGQSFIRSFAFLSKSTDEGDAIAAWYGATKMV